jgi:twinkle protein
MGEGEKGRFMGHGPCKICGSSDALAWYEKPSGKIDGYCWAHRGYVKEDGEPLEFSEDVPRPKLQLDDVRFLPIKSLPARRLTEATCNLFEVRTEYSEETGEVEKIWFPYYNDKGEIISYKWKTPDKKMGIIGMGKDAPFFGIKGWESKGKAVFITEGEEDAMAAYQMFKAKGKNYKVISIPNGSASAKNVCQRYLEWLESFETIFLIFDNDDPGKKATDEVLSLFSSGKCKVVRLPEKDANECLKKEKQVEFYQAVVQAKAHKPEGIVSGTDTWEIYKNRPVTPCVAYPEEWNEIQEKTYGMRIGELETWTSGSGMGKTQVIRELQYHLLQSTTDNIGVIALEEPLVDSVEALMAVHLKRGYSFQM